MVEKRNTARYTVVYEGADAELGKVAVCIEGEHDLTDKTFVTLDHQFHVFQVARGEARPLKDQQVAESYVCLAKSYFYMTEGTIVTSESQPTEEDIEGSSTRRLDVPEYKVVIIEHCGVVEHGDDMYQISVSHPGPGVYLVVLLEIIDTDPLTFRSVDLKDRELINGIIDCYLLEIGAIEEADASSDDEN